MSQSLIFDMDGTLFQTDKILELSLEDTFNHLRARHEWFTSTPIDKYREIMGAARMGNAITPAFCRGEGINGRVFPGKINT